jgi:hypothetical protein
MFSLQHLIVDMLQIWEPEKKLYFLYWYTDSWLYILSQRI